MSIIEREDLRRGLGSIEREINGLVQGRQLIEKAWGFFKIMGKELGSALISKKEKRKGMI